MQMTTIDPLKEIRSDIIRDISLLVMALTIPGLWLILDSAVFSVELIALWLGVFIWSWWTNRLAEEQSSFANPLFLWGGSLSLCALIILSGNVFLPLLGLFVAMLSPIFVKNGDVILGGCTVVLAWYLDITVGRGYPLSFILFLFLVSVMFSRLIIYRLFTPIEWYSYMHRRNDTLLHELQIQKGELRRTVKSLNIAYDTQKRIQQQLRASQKKAEEAKRLKERFAANISHEFRTPLNIIMGFSEMLHFSPEIYGNVNWTPMLSRDVHQIYRSSCHLSDMIDDVLDLSHFEQTRFSVTFEDVDFGEFMSDTVRLAANIFRDHDVRFESNIPDSLPRAQIDKTRIRQVILNLLSNAARFTVEGAVRLSVAEQENSLMVCVEDTGIGIDTEAIKHIFDEYYQVDYSLSRQHGGAGLGLAISKKFIEAHNGTISVQSQLGNGSTFTFILPIMQSNKPEPSLPATSTYAEVPEIPRCVVAINDNTLSMTQLQSYLTEFQVVEVSEAEALPDAISTYQPLAVIHNTKLDASGEKIPELPIPYIRCNVYRVPQVLVDLGINDYVLKPVTSSKLIDIIQSVPDIRRLLVIDDDPAFVQLVARYIQSARLPVTTLRAYDRVEALKMARERDPQLILIDMVLHDVTDLELIRSLRAELPSVPIVILTAAAYQLSNYASRDQELCITWSDHRYPQEVFQSIRAVVNILNPRFGVLETAADIGLRY